MTREEIEREAIRKSLSYNTKYAESRDFEDMLSRPQDFIEGSIARMADLLRKKAYRDGMVDGAVPREERIAELEQKKNEDINTMDKCVEYWKNKSKLLEEKLIKAKEIIKNLIVFAEMDDREYEKEYKEAEQFLKEE